MSCVALCEIINHPDVKVGDTGNNINLSISKMISIYITI